MVKVGKNKKVKKDNGNLIEKVPGDTAVSLSVKNLKLTFLESSILEITPLVQFFGDDLFIEVTHRTLGGAMAISSILRWDKVQVDCAETENELCPTKLRPVFWVQKGKKSQPFVNLKMVHVIPYNSKDTECHSVSLFACVAGVRLAGGMNYTESLLHRFGILGLDGGPGVGLSKGLDRLSAGPFSKLFKPSSIHVEESEFIEEKDGGFLELGVPDDVDVVLELKDWLFALEGADVVERMLVKREERSWHTTFESFKVKANSRKSRLVNGRSSLKHPIESVTVGVEGLKTLKPQQQHKGDLQTNGQKESAESAHGGVDLEADIVLSEDDGVNETIKWIIESIKFSVKNPVEAVVTKDELSHVAKLCKSEVDSMGRITAGALRVLKLENSIGQTAMNQLSNLGSEGFDKIFSQENVHRYSNGNGKASSSSVDLGSNDYKSTLTSLEAVLLDTQSNCSALVANLSGSESSKQHLQSVEQLTQKLKSMQKLLAKLQTQV